MDDGVAQLGLDARAVLDAAPDGMVIVADDGRIVAVNSELERLFGYSAAEMLGDVDRAARARRCSRHPRRAAPGLRRWNRGGARWASAGTSTANVATGRCSRSRSAWRASTTAEGAMTFAAVRDVTSRVESEELLADANRRRALAEDHDRIARDLHDTVIQELFGVGLGLQGLQIAGHQTRARRAGSPRRSTTSTRSSGRSDSRSTS